MKRVSHNLVYLYVPKVSTSPVLLYFISEHSPLSELCLRSSSTYSANFNSGRCWNLFLFLFSLLITPRSRSCYIISYNNTKHLTLLWTLLCVMNPTLRVNSFPSFISTELLAWLYKVSFKQDKSLFYFFSMHFVVADWFLYTSKYKILLI